MTSKRLTFQFVIILLVTFISLPTLAGEVRKYSAPSVSAQLTESIPLMEIPRVYKELDITGFGSTIYIVDDFSIDHPDEQQVGFSHGEYVASIIQSIAPDAEIWTCDASTRSTNGKFTSEAITNCLNNLFTDSRLAGVQVVNLSLGTKDFRSQEYCSPIDDGVVIERAARELGIAVVASAGNRAANGEYYTRMGISFPGCMRSTISVGAVYDGDIFFNALPDSFISQVCPWQDVAKRDMVVCYSQAAPILDVLAPGSRIETELAPSSLWQALNKPIWHGTSWAAPHVTGVVSLMFAADPSLSNNEVRNILTNTGKTVWDDRYGLQFPRVNAYHAVKAAMERSDDQEPVGVPISSVRHTHPDQITLRQRTEVQIQVEVEQNLKAYTVTLETDQSITVLGEDRFVELNVSKGETITHSTTMSCVTDGDHIIRSIVMPGSADPITTETTITCKSANEEQPPSSPEEPSSIEDFDTNGNHFIDDTEFMDAIDAWLDDEISDSLFFEVMDAWTAQTRVGGSSLSLSTQVSYKIYDLSGHLIERVGCRAGRPQMLAQRTLKRSNVPLGTYIAVIEDCQTGRTQRTTVPNLH